MPRAAAIRMLAMLATASALAAADGATLSFTADRMPTRTLLAALTDVTGVEHELDQRDLSSEALERPATLALVDASPRGERQAVAVALDLAWSAADGRVRFARAPVPAGAVVVRLHDAATRGGGDIEPIARQLLAPWLAAPDAGLAWLADDNRWYATLAPSGHARLVATLALIDRGGASCPSAIPDADAPDPRRTLASAVSAHGWRGFALALAASAKLSVTLAPSLDEAGGDLAIPPCPFAELPTRLAALGAQAAIVHGVLCLDAAPPRDREAAWQRASVALLPLGHLARDDVEATAICAELATHVCPDAWRAPGCGLFVAPGHRALLACADPAALADALDALGRIDLLGLDDGLASLATAPAAARSAP